MEENTFSVHVVNIKKIWFTLHVKIQKETYLKFTV